MRKICVSLFAGVFAACLMGGGAHGAILHLWEFDGQGASALSDSVGGLNLGFAPGEGNVGGVVGHPSDVSFAESDYSGFGRAYRPFYVDPNQSSTAGAGLTGSGFTSPNQFTIETIVKADQKQSGSAVNYIFQTRPGSDRGYYLVQDEDNTPRGTTSGLGSIVGNNFGDASIPAGQSDDGHWWYVALVIDLTSNAGQAVGDIWAADLSGGGALTQLVTGKAWNTADPSALAGETGIFGIGNFSIDRDGDTIAEASQEWFQGAIDYVAIYDGLLSQSELQSNLDAATTRTPEPASFLLLGLGGLSVVLRRRR